MEYFDDCLVAGAGVSWKLLLPWTAVTMNTSPSPSLLLLLELLELLLLLELDLLLNLLSDSFISLSS